VLAIGPNDGKIKWGYQYTPNDPYDFDEISEHPIINAKVNGEDRKLVVHAARNGFYYALDRTNGSFIAGKTVCRSVELDARPRPQDRPSPQLRSGRGDAGRL
jgi:glucose dehydrogenase